MMLCTPCRAKVDFYYNLSIDPIHLSPTNLVYCREIPHPAVPCTCYAHAEASTRQTRLSDWPNEPGAGRTGGPFACPGRVVIALWRTLMHEVGVSFQPIVLRSKIPDLHKYEFRNIT